MPSPSAGNRAHLVEDVRLAEDLSIRFADSAVGRIGNDAWTAAQENCRSDLFAGISRRHSVPEAEVAALMGARDWWFDLFVLLLPAALPFFFASRRIAGGLLARYDAEDRWLPLLILVFLTPLVAGMGVLITQQWGWIVESLRLRNDHISYRVFLLPASRHGWLLWGIGMLLFATAALSALLRTKRDPAKSRVAHR
jgi:hypothetical protein